MAKITRYRFNKDSDKIVFLHDIIVAFLLEYGAGKEKKSVEIFIKNNVGRIIIT